MSTSTKKPTWSSIKPAIVTLNRNELVSLIKDLFDASQDNRLFLTARFPGDEDSEAALAEYKTRIREQFYPKRGYGDPKASVCRKVISDYRKARGDIRGIAELMLVYVESGTQFTNDYGDIDEAFYYSLESVLDELAKLLMKPGADEIYCQLQDRLARLATNASQVGWGYTDAVDDSVRSLYEHYSISSE